VELRHLRYFIRAAELLHFTRAAEALYISQPTLSIHIQQLEEELGAELFARVGRKVRLTEAGELLLIRARQAMRELEAAAQEIDATTGLLRGSMSIAALPLYSSRLLPSWMTAFNSLHPNVHIKARSGSSDDIEAGILAGTIDLGFSIVPVEHPEINVRELFADDVVMVVSKDHPIARVKKLELGDLRTLPMALASPRIVASRLLRKYFDENAVVPNVVVEFDDGHALVEIAKMGSLVTFLPKSGVMEDPSILLLPLPDAGLRVTAAALWLYLSPAGKSFLEIATQEAKALQWTVS